MSRKTLFGTYPIISIVVLISGPVYAVKMHRTVAWNGLGCEEEQIGVMLNGNSSVLVNVVDNQHKERLRIPVIRHKDFLRVFPGSISVDVRTMLENISPPYTFVSTYVPDSGRHIFILLNKLKLRRDETVLACIPIESKTSIPVGSVLTNS